MKETFIVKRDKSIVASRISKKWICMNRREGTVIGRFRYKANAVNAANLANSIEEVTR
jgi:hypothetical protein